MLLRWAAGMMSACCTLWPGQRQGAHQRDGRWHLIVEQLVRPHRASGAAGSGADVDAQGLQAVVLACVGGGIALG